MRAKKIHIFPVKPMAALLAVGLFGGQASAQPFASIPLHFQSSETTKAGGVKPNVAVVFDNSGSMLAEVLDGQGNSLGRRDKVAREALLRILRNDVYRNNINWEFLKLNNGKQPNFFRYLENGQSKALDLDDARRLGKYLENPAIPFGITPEHMEAQVEKFWTFDYFGTPTVERYMDALHILRDALDRPGVYRCQKSYVLIFSDGGANGLGRYMEGDDAKGWTPTDNPFYGGYRGDFLWFAQKGAYRYLHPDPDKFVGNMLLRENGNYVWNNDTENPWTNAYVQSLQYFAETVHQTDLKTGGVDAAGKSWDDPAADPINQGRQTIGTFSIGFGYQGNSEQLDRSSVLTGQRALMANSPGQLNAAFEQIFRQIINETLVLPSSSYSSVSPALLSEDTTSVIPSMAATIHLNLEKGNSEIRFYDVSASSANVTTVGSAYKTPDFSNRKVIVGPSATQPANWLDNLAANNALFDIPDTSTNVNEWKDSLIPWLMRYGDDSLANKPGNALQYRVRDADSRQMGDVINAPVLTYGSPSYGRQKYLITAANDGMVYLFQSSPNSSHPYELKLNYLPGFMPRETADDTLIRNLKHLVDPKYITDAAKPHLYMLDGGMTLRSTDKNGPEQIFMVGNLGRGGRGTYAINVGGHKRSDGSQKVGIDASESAWITSVPLFETAKGTAADQIGYSIGSPSVARISPDRSLAADGTMTTNLYDVKYATFVGSGVKSAANPLVSESALYVYNVFGGENVGLQVTSGSQPINAAQSGELLRKISVGDTGGLMEPTVVDVNFDGVVDIAYAADYNGGLYRFDLRNGTPSSWTAHKIFQTKNNRPVTSAPAIVRHATNKYIVIFGTGSDLYQADLGNRDIQSVYGIYDDLTVNHPGQVAVSDLLEQTFGLTTVDGQQARVLSDNQIASHHKGWFFDLPAGERVVLKPSVLLRTVLLSTRNYSVNTTGNTAPPTNDPCIGSSHSVQSKGESWIMQFRSDTGGILPSSNSRDPDRDLFAYVDFFKQNAEGKPNVRLQTMLSGAQVSQSLVHFATSGVYNSDSDAAGGSKSAVSLHGDSSVQTGRDPTLNNNPNNTDNLPDICFSSENSKIFVTDSEKGLQNVYNIYGKVCGSELRRISWREIF